MDSAGREQALRELEEKNDPDLAGVRELLQHREQADAEQFLVVHQEGDGPDHIGRYRVVAPLGRGGQADLFRAVHPTTAQDVVIKWARKDLDEQFWGKLRDEAEIAGKAKGPGVVQVLDADVWEGRPYLVFEYLDGPPLTRQAQPGPLPPRRAAELVMKAGRVLARLHAAGVLHRDLNPANIMLDASGRPTLIDFGLSSLIRQWSETNPPQHGVVCGTPPYMAPEQAEGRADRIGPWTDVFNLGATLYHLLTGHPPYEGPHQGAVLERAKQGELVPPGQRLRLALEGRAGAAQADQGAGTSRPRTRRIPRALGRICLKAMAKEPERRYSARGMGRALWFYLWGRYLLGGVFGAAVLLVLVTWLWPFSPEVPPKVGLRVLHYGYELQTDKEKPQGPIGGESMEALVDDRILVRAELSSPGYCYVIGFNFDGNEQLLWPRNENQKRGDPTGDPTVAPPRLDRVQCPPPPADGEEQRALRLDDDPRGGMQAYVVVASRQALPTYEEWKSGRAGQGPWRYLPASPGVWRSDGQTLDPVQPGDVRLRGSEVELVGQPPLLQLARWARGPGVTVEAVAFPVYRREKR